MLWVPVETCQTLEKGISDQRSVISKNEAGRRSAARDWKKRTEEIELSGDVREAIGGDCGRGQRNRAEVFSRAGIACRSKARWDGGDAGGPRSGRNGAGAGDGQRVAHGRSWRRDGRERGKGAEREWKSANDYRSD